MGAKNVQEIDVSKKLEITINNNRPVALADLTLSLLSFNQQFQKFIETDANKDQVSATELFVKDVRSGSIIIELGRVHTSPQPIDLAGIYSVTKIIKTLHFNGMRCCVNKP